MLLLDFCSTALLTFNFLFVFKFGTGTLFSKSLALFEGLYSVPLPLTDVDSLADDLVLEVEGATVILSDFEEAAGTLSSFAEVEELDELAGILFEFAEAAKGFMASLDGIIEFAEFDDEVDVLPELDEGDFIELEDVAGVFVGLDDVEGAFAALDEAEGVLVELEDVGGVFFNCGFVFGMLNFVLLFAASTVAALKLMLNATIGASINNMVPIAEPTNNVFSFNYTISNLIKLLKYKFYRLTSF